MNKKELLEPMKSALNAWQSIKDKEFTDFDELMAYASSIKCTFGICCYFDKNYDCSIKDLFYDVYGEQFKPLYLTVTIGLSVTLVEALETVDFRIYWLKKEIAEIEQMP